MSKFEQRGGLNWLEQVKADAAEITRERLVKAGVKKSEAAERADKAVEAETVPTKQTKK